MQFGVFTATQRLRRAIKATRIPLIEFAPAPKSRVSNPQDWGSYYENDPWVCGMADTFLRQAKNRLSASDRSVKPHLQVA